jgi:hypothetical protein
MKSGRSSAYIFQLLLMQAVLFLYACPDYGVRTAAADSAPLACEEIEECPDELPDEVFRESHLIVWPCSCTDLPAESIRFRHLPRRAGPLLAGSHSRLSSGWIMPLRI